MYDVRTLKRSKSRDIHSPTHSRDEDRKKNVGKPETATFKRRLQWSLVAVAFATLAELTNHVDRRAGQNKFQSVNARLTRVVYKMVACMLQYFALTNIRKKTTIVYIIYFI